MKLSSAIFNKIESIVASIMPIPDVEREIRMKRRKKRFKMGFVNIAGKIYKQGVASIKEQFQTMMIDKFNFFSSFNEEHLKNLIQYNAAVTKALRAKGKKTQIDKVIVARDKRLQSEYLAWAKKRNQEKAEANKVDIEEEEQFSGITIANKISDKLSKFIIKIKLNINTLRVSITDDNDEQISSISVYIGDVDLLMDEVYSQAHSLRLLGVTIESKKRLYILGMLVDVII